MPADETPKNPSSDSPSPSTAPDKKGDTPKKGRRILRKIALSGLVLMVLGAAGVGGAEYYTGRPEFCGTCHVMDPYYKSWAHDKHGAKFGVRCVDCHYAPGEKFTFKAKFKGLSQATSYFSGRYGSARPRAHVANASCLVSGCHGDNEFRSKSLLLGEVRTEKRLIGGQMVDIERKPTVRFLHNKHIGSNDRTEEIEAELAAIAGRLRSALDADGFTAVQAAARSIDKADARTTGMKVLLSRLKKTGGEIEADAMQLMQLEHRKVRLHQLDGLICTACHTYNGDGNTHFTVNYSTCFTCHLINQEFNSDTGRCLGCHEAPTRKLTVHGGGSGSTSMPGVSTSAVMDHHDIVERGINCASCHFDVIQGDSTVSIRDCERCHDQEIFLKGFDERDVDTVEEYHKVHIAGQKAHCLDCHRAVKHELIEADAQVANADFVQPVRNDCQHCHPNHHEEQVEMLMGLGGEGPVQSMPNAMFGSRLNCRGCHTQAGNDFKGDSLITATKNTCVTCHNQDYEKLFEQWISEIANYQKEAQQALDRVDERIRILRAANQEPAADILEKVEHARANIRFVSTANGVHNKNYAMQLLDLSIRDMDNVLIKLAN